MMFNLHFIYNHLDSPRNKIVAQANKTATNKNTTNEQEKNIMTIPLYTNKLCNISLNSQYPLQVLNHLTEQVCMIFIFCVEFFSTVLKKHTGQVKREI